MQFANGGLEALFTVSIIWLTLSWIATSLRIYVRGFMIRQFGWDDWLQLASMLSFSCEVLITVIKVCPQPKITTIAYLKEFADYILVGSSFYITTSLLLKISLALFFLRIVREPWQRRTIIWSTVLYTLLGTTFLIVLEVQCANTWSLEPVYVREHCGKWSLLGPFNYTYAAINAVTDWTFALVPIYSVYKLQMSKAAKVTSSILLGLGAVASIASLVRLGYIEGLNIGKQLFPSPAIGITSILELGITQTACCLATLRPLFSKWSDNFKTVASRSRASFKGSNGTRQRNTVTGTNGTQRGTLQPGTAHGVDKIMAETEVVVRYEAKDMV